MGEAEGREVLVAEGSGGPRDERDDAGEVCGAEAAPAGACLTGLEQLQSPAASATTTTPAMLRRRPGIISSR